MGHPLYPPAVDLALFGGKTTVVSSSFPFSRRFENANHSLWRRGVDRLPGVDLQNEAWQAMSMGVNEQSWNVLSSQRTGKGRGVTSRTRIARQAGCQMVHGTAM